MLLKERMFWRGGRTDFLFLMRGIGKLGGLEGRPRIERPSSRALLLLLLLLFRGAREVVED